MDRYRVALVIDVEVRDAEQMHRVAHPLFKTGFEGAAGELPNVPYIENTDQAADYLAQDDRASAGVILGAGLFRGVGQLIDDEHFRVVHVEWRHLSPDGSQPE